MNYYYDPKVKLLLIGQPIGKEVMNYMNINLKVPKIGPRPPYYCNPRYEQYYPKI